MRKIGNAWVNMLIGVLSPLLVFTPFFGQEKTMKDDRPYVVSVDVMTTPLFVVDDKGNPVNDIRQEELMLLVNNKPTDILTFKHISFDDEVESGTKQEPADTLPVKQEAALQRERVIFIILDTMFNGITSFRRSQDIAINLIKNSSKWDQFVLLENNPFGGLKYLGGPDNDKEKLTDILSALRPPADKWYEGLHRSREISNNLFFDPSRDARVESEQWKSTKSLQDNSDRQQYQNQVKRFIEVLSQFKYALKTIDKPKIVFLISEGVAMDAFRAEYGKEVTYLETPASSSDEPGRGFYSIFNKGESTVFDNKKLYSAFMLSYLVEIVHSINSGGSVLYTISPKRMDDTNDPAADGDASLRFLASESGGKFFSGSQPVEIAQRIKKTTTAYYEVYFRLLPDMGKSMSVQVKCSRPGVHVHSLVHTEKNNPYFAMEKIQKKIFALNTATQGTWSRIVGKVMQGKFKAALDNNLISVNIPLPNVMQNKKLDIFLIRMHPKTQETVVDFMEGNVKTSVELKFKKRKDMRQFFVLVEPSKPYCLYNEVME